jgi:hypothetical protein
LSVKDPSRFTRARLVLAGLGWRVFVRQYRWPLLVVLLLAGLAASVIAVVVLATSGGSSSSTAASVNTYGAALPAVPTNHVTGSGTGSVELRGDTATVTLNTTGLLNGSPHLAHIHGLGLGTCPTASSARLHNGHLSISTGDALRLYGSTLTSFTEWGSTSGSVPSNIDMNRYPANGNIRYRRTMTVTRLVGDLIRDGDAVIVVHGIDYNYNHIYDFPALGVSDLDKTLPGEATAPALCGTLRLSSRTQASADGGATAYVASLKPPVASSGASAKASASTVAADTRLSSDGGQSDRISLFCDLG